MSLSSSSAIITEPNNVLPLRADPNNLDGKFTDPTNPPLPISKAISRALHQCLVAEVAFDPVAIPLGVDTSNSDKLAQRSIAWSPSGSAEAVTTFEIRPTTVERLEGQPPDELMIDWGTMPIGSVASIYLPSVGAGEILSMANRMYTRHGLKLGSDDTLRCRAHGVTYVPIPPGAGSNYAGLLSIETPPAMRRGRTHTVVVRQVTNASGVGEIKSPRGRGRARSISAESVRELKWRRVIGAFQLTMPVRQKAALLPREERWLSVLRWIGEAIPHGNRWFPVYHRYLGIIAGRVKAFGGDPAKIWPSPTGDGGHPPGHPGGGPGHPGGGPGHPGGGPHPGGPGHPGPHERERFTGKVAGIAYDSFGDFEAFVIETREGERQRFESHEGRVLALVERAWMHRILMTVVARPNNPGRPLEIILHGAPPDQS